MNGAPPPTFSIVNSMQHLFISYTVTSRFSLLTDSLPIFCFPFSFPFSSLCNNKHNMHLSTSSAVSSHSMHTFPLLARLTLAPCTHVCTPHLLTDYVFCI